MCFNLRFESDEDLAAIAAGMSLEPDGAAYAADHSSDGSSDGSSGGPVGVPAR